METVIIVVHLMVVVALIATVLLQRSEGGALGMGGGGGGGGGFMSNRGAANALTRATTILAVVFFSTSLGLTLMARLENPPSSILNTIQQPDNAAGSDSSGDAPSTGNGILGTLKQQSGESTSGPQTPPAE